MELIAVRPTPPVRAALEKALAYIKVDELWKSRQSRSGCARRCSTPTRASVPSAPS